MGTKQQDCGKRGNMPQYVHNVCIINFYGNKTYLSTKKA